MTPLSDDLSMKEDVEDVEDVEDPEDEESYIR